MSDPMEDVDLLVSIREAMLAHLNDCAAVDCAAEAAVRAILSAGYRIVKLADAEWAEFDASSALRNGARQVIRRCGVRGEAIEMILQDSSPDKPIYEIIATEVSRSSLLAELESMKEAGE